MSSLSGPRGLVIAAARSGAGKTTVALGLMRALARRRLAVQPFKCGPDYIDPAFHAAAAGRPSFNLDPWAMRRALIAELILEKSSAWDFAVAEGVMGLFDGAVEPGQSGSGSTADLAAITGWPVVLVLDVSHQAETAAAVALGCARYRADVRVVGVILNRVSSVRHENLVIPAIERIGLMVLGALPRDATLSLAERHLGLVQAVEASGLEEKVNRLADAVEDAVRVDDVASLAARAYQGAGCIESVPKLRPPGQRIALAQDRAFSFVYPHILEGWRAAGAEIRLFSPLADEGPDLSADAVWLPGGYPELHAGELARAEGFQRGLKEMARRSVPVHGECGGYMVLGAGIEDASGGHHAMAGLLGLETSFKERRLHLGYRRVRLLADSALGREGETLFGHEFHYASRARDRDAPLFADLDGHGGALPEAGSRRGSVSGTFFHVIDRAE